QTHHPSYANAFFASLRTHACGGRGRGRRRGRPGPTSSGAGSAAGSVAGICRARTRTYLLPLQVASEYAVAAKLDHPRSVNLREDDLLPRIDAWLTEAFGEDHIDETCEAMAAVAHADAT